jgi:CRISPR-associated exonuclease Cas4
MNIELLLIVALLLIACAALLLRRARHERAAVALPAGKLVYQDDGYEEAEILYSTKHKLKGKPDSLVRQPDGTIIPIERKTGRTPDKPYFGHVMQVITYCILVEENYKVRPPHGIIQYPNRKYEIQFTPQEESRLLTLIAEMQRKREMESIPRNHYNPRICAACSYRSMCDERLDE